MEEEQVQYVLIRNNIKNIYISIQDGKVIVKAPKRVSNEEIQKLLQEKKKWIEKSLEKSKKKEEKIPLYSQEEFLEIIQKNVKQLIETTGLKPNRVRVKTIKYAWGSCSSGKNITLNQKLIYYSEKAICYVILHELCHLKYMNHSKDFWNLVAKYMPEYKEVRKEFK